MKITCEHCGTVINTSKDKNCPNCGAPYAKSKEFKEVNDLDKRDKEASVRTKELGNEIIENTMSTFKTAHTLQKIISVFAFILFFAIVIFGFVMFRKNIVNPNDKEIIEVVPVEVSFNEDGVGTDFEIKCDGVSKYKYDVFENDRGEGIEYYNFHLVFKNKSKTYKALTETKLTYTDENGNPDVFAKWHMSNANEMSKAIDLIATKEGTYTGNIVFEVPDYVKDVTLKYENVIIKIEDFKGKIG